MKAKREATRLLLLERVGLELDRVIVTARLAPGSAPAGPSAVWVAFTGRRPLRLFVPPEGKILAADEADPEPVELGGGAELIVRELTRRSPFAGAQGKRLASVSRLSRGDADGYLLDFGAAGKVGLVPRGAELGLSRGLPEGEVWSEVSLMPRPTP